MSLSKCPICGVEFRARNGNQKYCGPQCRKKASAIISQAASKAKRSKRLHRVVKCKHCGKEFSQNSPRQLYCCTACRQMHNNEKGWARDKARRRAAQVTIYCSVCGKEIVTSRKDCRYCSDECRQIARKLKVSPERTCPVCGRATQNLVYCCAACRDKDIETKNKTANSPIRYDAGYFSMTSPEGIPACSTQFCPLG